VVGIAIIARLMPRFVHYQIDHDRLSAGEATSEPVVPVKEA